MQALGYHEIWPAEWHEVTESGYNANVTQAFKDGDSSSVPERSYVFKTKRVSAPSADGSDRRNIVTLKLVQEFAKWYNDDAYELETQVSFKTVPECAAFLKEHDMATVWDKFMTERHLHESAHESKTAPMRTSALEGTGQMDSALPMQTASMTLVFPSTQKMLVGDRLRVHLYFRPKTADQPSTLLPDTTDTWELIQLRDKLSRVRPLTDCFMWYPTALVLRASKDVESIPDPKHQQQQQVKTGETRAEVKSDVKAADVKVEVKTIKVESFNALIGNSGCNFAMSNVPQQLVRRLNQLHQSKTPILVAFETTLKRSDDQESDSESDGDVRMSSV
jgi:hypothetical protein